MRSLLSENCNFNKISRLARKRKKSDCNNIDEDIKQRHRTQKNYIYIKSKLTDNSRCARVSHFDIFSKLDPA